MNITVMNGESRRRYFFEEEVASVVIEPSGKTFGQEKQVWGFDRDDKQVFATFLGDTGPIGLA